MAKKYTRAEWARLQASLPEEDRVPYEDSPEDTDTAADAAARTQRFQEVIEPGVAPEDFPVSITGVRTEPGTSTGEGSTDEKPGLFYNYYTGEWVSDPSLIKPRTGMGGAESGGGTILVTEEDYKNAGFVGSTGPTGPTGTTGKTLVSTYTDPTTGDVIAVYSDGTTAILSKGTKASDAAKAKAEADALAKAGRQSAYDLLFQQFDAYGLGALVTPLKGLIESGISPAEFTIRLRETDAYKKRFAANASRIQKGLRALSEAEYIGLEDQYQDVMRRYGLPDTYYTRGEMGRQEGFEKFIGGDVSPVELEDRIQTAQRRVLNAPPEVTNALKQFYGAELGSGDILAYVLDPDKAIENIKRKVTAAEIGAGAMQAGLATGVSRAEELARFGVTGEQARERYQTIGGFLPRASQLGDIYAKQGMGPYTQTTAEQEVFGLTGAVDAEKRRRQLAQLEQAQFGGSAGTTGGALGRERAGQF
jgi:hypothetical protein